MLTNPRRPAVAALFALITFGCGFGWKRHCDYVSRTVPCMSCSQRFVPGENKAPLFGAAIAGAAVGGAAGGATGALLGTGTGLAIGGVGAVPGAPVGAALGAVGGVIVGGFSGAWYRDRRVKCPACGAVFLYPNNQ
jgi:hypothetical protein